MRRRTWVLGLGSLLCLALPSCDDSSEGKTPIVIGLISPTEGALRDEGADWNVVAQLAVAEINARGGVNGHSLELIIKNDKTDAALAATMLDELIDEGAVAVIGPGFSGAATMAYPIARDRMVPIMSPASTSPTLDFDVSVDGGYLFRDVPNDGIQSIAMSIYLKEIAVSRVVVVHEATPYGTGFRDAFKHEFVDIRQGVIADTAVEFTQNVTVTAADTIVDDMMAVLQPDDVVVLVAVEHDALEIVKRCDERGLGVKWFFTDGERSEGFRAGLPQSVIESGNILGGTAATNPTTGAAYSVLRDAYMEEQGHSNIVIYSSNVWDAVFLFGAALAQQEHDFPGEPLGGDHLRLAVTKVSKGGQIFHAGQWRDLLASIRAGADIDYDGASGPVDFDDNGETVSPYEIWKINPDGTFGRVRYYEAACLTSGQC